MLWQLRVVIVRVARALKRGVAAPTYTDGMQVLIDDLGADSVHNLACVRQRLVDMREANGDKFMVVVKAREGVSCIPYRCPNPNPKP